MTQVRTLDDIDVEGRRVVLRADLNVPMRDGAVADATRIEAAARTVRALLDRGAAIIVLSHFGRPGGKPVAGMSLAPVAPALAEAVGRPVRFVATDWRDGNAERAAGEARPGDVLLMENTRFHPGEEANDPAFAGTLAGLGAAYVSDAFSAAHRAHASTEGIARHLPSAAGLTMQDELDALDRALGSPQRPVMAIVGGAKISTKLDLLANLSARVDVLAIGGAMANTFLAAQGHPVGKSLCEHDMAGTARDVVASAARAGCEVVLPEDVVAATAFEEGAPHRTCGLDDVGADEMILDIGPRTVARLERLLEDARTLVWNGPFGAFEIAPFDAGTNAVAACAARLTAGGRLASIAGGGDTVAALKNAGAAGGFSYVSTAGGAFLEWLEGKDLPGVAVLRN